MPRRFRITSTSRFGAALGRGTAAGYVAMCALLGAAAMVPGAENSRVAAPPMVPAAFTGFSGSGVAAYGDAAPLPSFSGLTVAFPLVAMAPTPTGHGYWVAAADGGVFAFGDAAFYGSMGGSRLFAPVAGMAATPDGKGYWLVGADGGVFAFGDAAFYGSMGATHLNEPVVGMAATPDGKGYWLVAADGGVFCFGDAAFYGSMGAVKLAQPVTAMAVTPDGEGYWLVGADGGVFAFGDAGFHGSAAGQKLDTWVSGIAATPDGQGYWLVAATAGVIVFGDAVSYGPTPNTPPFPPTAAIAPTPDGKGYWLLQPDSVQTSFADPGPAEGAAAQRAVQIAAGLVGPDPDTAQGKYCNPYGPCEAWCALFATWVWNQAGIPIPRFAFVGNVYTWAAARHREIAATAMPVPGDFVIYGTGPQNANTAPHMAIVTAVWPDGAIATVDGDAGPEPEGQYGVVTNGPFLPADSQSYNAMPVYAYVVP